MTTQEMLSPMRRAVNDFNLIENGDKVAVGVSGGKDSLTLLKLLHEFQRFSDRKFDLMGITIDMGFTPNAYQPIQEFCDRLGIDYRHCRGHIRHPQGEKPLQPLRKNAARRTQQRNRGARLQQTCTRTSHGRRCGNLYA